MVMNKDNEKAIAEKLLNFRKKVSEPLLRAATDKEGYIDTALLITGMAMTMDGIFKAVSEETKVSKRQYAIHFINIIKEHIKDKD